MNCYEVAVLTSLSNETFQESHIFSYSSLNWLSPQYTVGFNILPTLLAVIC